jgi:hypothetical protein
MMLELTHLTCVRKLAEHGSYLVQLQEDTTDPQAEFLRAHPQGQFLHMLGLLHTDKALLQSSLPSHLMTKVPRIHQTMVVGGCPKRALHRAVS